MKQIEQDSLWVIAFGVALIGTSAGKSTEEAVLYAKRIANAIMQDTEIVGKVRRLLENQK